MVQWIFFSRGGTAEQRVFKILIPRRVSILKFLYTIENLRYGFTFFTPNIAALHSGLLLVLPLAKRQSLD
jgi:hypothetical protein